MPRSLRSRQVEFEPGTSNIVDGKYKDENDRDVIVRVDIRSCEEPGDGSQTVTKSDDGKWTVVLPPDAVRDLEPLVGEDGIAVRLTVVALACEEDEQGRVDEIAHTVDVAAESPVAPPEYVDIACPSPDPAE